MVVGSMNEKQSVVVKTLWLLVLIQERANELLFIAAMMESKSEREREVEREKG